MNSLHPFIGHRYLSPVTHSELASPRELGSPSFQRTKYRESLTSATTTSTGNRKVARVLGLIIKAPMSMMCTMRPEAFVYLSVLELVPSRYTDRVSSVSQGDA